VGLHRAHTHRRLLPAIHRPILKKQSSGPVGEVIRDAHTPLPRGDSRSRGPNMGYALGAIACPSSRRTRGRRREWERGVEKIKGKEKG